MVLFAVACSCLLLACCCVLVFGGWLLFVVCLGVFFFFFFFFVCVACFFTYGKYCVFGCCISSRGVNGLLFYVYWLLLIGLC